MYYCTKTGYVNYNDDEAEYASLGNAHQPTLKNVLYVLVSNRTHLGEFIAGIGCAQSNKFSEIVYPSTISIPGSVKTSVMLRDWSSGSNGSFRSYTLNAVLFQNYTEKEAIVAVNKVLEAFKQANIGPVAIKKFNSPGRYSLEVYNQNGDRAATIMANKQTSYYLFSGTLNIYAHK